MELITLRKQLQDKEERIDQLLAQVKEKGPMGGKFFDVHSEYEEMGHLKEAIEKLRLQVEKIEAVDRTQDVLKYILDVVF